jgi:hypothetical protein
MLNGIFIFRLTKSTIPMSNEENKEKFSKEQRKNSVKDKGKIRK